MTHIKTPRPTKLSRRTFLAGSALISASGAASFSSVPAVGGAALPGAWSAGLERAVMLSVRNIAHEGLDDVFPRPFEIDLLRADAQLRSLVALRTMEAIGGGRFDPANFSVPEWIDVPKRKYGARRTCAAVDMLDAAAYLALAVLAAPAIESRRIPLDRQTVFSYRFAPGRGRLFDRRYAYASFVQAARARRGSANFEVVCDIADFYGTVSADLVRRSLRRAGVAAELTEFLAELLEFWAVDGRRGLPIGSNASRILAEAVLAPVDQMLHAGGVEFVRYVDDFYLFVDDPTGATRALEMLRDVLAAEQFALNSDKTRIVALERDRQRDSAPWQSPDVPAPGGGVRLTQGRRGRGAEPSDERRRRSNLPRNFRPATAREVAAMRRGEASPDVVSFLQGDLAPPWQLRRSLRRAIYCNQVEFLRAVPALVARYPEFAEYVVGALSHCSTKIPDEVRHHIAEQLATLLFDVATPPFVAVRLVELLAADEYRQREAIEKYARFLAADVPGLRLRAALQALRRTGGIPGDVRLACGKGDIWSHRELLADGALRASEAEPFDPIDARLLQLTPAQASSQRA